MRVHNKAAAVVAIAVAMMGLAATGASAASSADSGPLGSTGVTPAATADPGSPTSGVVGGREFGPEDGYQVTTESYPAGDGPVDVYFGSAPSGTGITPMDTWGTSYAISDEDFQLHYHGKAKAAGNVYDGLRIIEVCIWYTRAPSSHSDTVCSDADSNGAVWTAGAEQHVTYWDSLNPSAPNTIFNIQTTRINPNVV